MESLHTLREAANRAIKGYCGIRRPTWAPPLVLVGELVTVLRELKWLSPDDKDVARLWARFSDPKRGPVTCVGFELRAGATRKGKCFWETLLCKSGDWYTGPTWMPPREPDSSWARRYPLAVRAVELGAERITQFAGNPDEEMRLGGILISTCSICGKTITDPISLERGVGPECWSRFTEWRDWIKAQTEAAA